MGLAFLWDTNIAIYYLQGQFPEKGEAFLDDILQDTPPAFSVITEIELLCWRSPTKEDKRVLYDLVSKAVVIGLSENIKSRTIEIRKDHK